MGRLFTILGLGAGLLGCATSSSNHSRGLSSSFDTFSTEVLLTPSDSPLKLDTSMLGLSYEKSELYGSLFREDNLALTALFNRLGPAVLRIGANAVDKTDWDPNGAGFVNRKVSPADLDRFIRFIRTTSWKVIYGINLANNTPKAAADEAATAYAKLGDRLLGLEIGNEPNLYHSNGLKPANYSYEDFKKEWETYETAIRARVPSVVFTGPAASSCCTTSYTLPFAQDEGSRISLLTQHYYRANGKLATSTMDLLLAPNPALISELRALSTANMNAHIKTGYRMAEANSFYAGGAPGRSNGFGTALWGVDFIFDNVMNGASGVNFHGGGDSTGYTPIANDRSGKVDGVRPVYYGMYLFSKMAGGELLNLSMDPPNTSISAYAVTHADGTYDMILNNKDRARSASAAIQLPGEASAGSMTLLTAPTLDSTGDYTLGGAAIATDGSWNPKTVTNFSISSRGFQVKVPAGSSAWIHAR